MSFSLISHKPMTSICCSAVAMVNDPIPGKKFTAAQWGGLLAESELLGWD
jgi:hypothetical protein